MTLKTLIPLRISQAKLFIRVLFARICAVFTPKKDFWLISERGTEARDNGYALYQWLKRNHPEINVKYIISKESKDFQRIESIDVVEYNSFRHLLSIWQAKYLISTHVMGYMPNHVFFARLDRYIHLLRGRKKIFIQHGITYNRQEALFCGNIDVNLFVCGSQYEYHYVKNTFGFPDGIVKYTGFCRYDNLLQYKNSKQILIMPTFRMYVDRNYFEDSEYYQKYSELICSKRFHGLLDKYDYTVVFYPHYEFQSNIASFKKLSVSDRIIIADMIYDVQQLLKESNLLVTDYSSVFFDMMYMNKPIVFYQFDKDRFIAEHYKSGYLKYEDVGPVVNDLSNLIDEIEIILKNSEDISRYQSYYSNTFTKRDTYNCERVYEAILQC
jgi:CDP-glycerol glycerophosphotransferase (TagB/SpsB family)